MKTILVITDFTNASRNAEIYASELAKLSHSKLLLYHILGALTDEQLESDQKISDEEIEQKLKAESNFLADISKVSVECLVKKSNSIDEIILLEAQGHIDLVIIGIDRLIPLNDVVFKGKMKDLIRKTHIPLILIPEEITFKDIKKIAFAVDFNLENKLKMHSSIKTIVKLFDSKLFVLNVVKENTEIRPQNKQESEYNIECYFGNMPHLYSFIENNDVIEGLKEFIRVNNIDMITMLPHKHNMIEKVMFESNTRKMVFHTTVPLLLLPEG